MNRLEKKLIKLKKEERKNNMLKKIKNKICEIICKVFKIKPCVCDHECNCKKEKK
jgi:septum formation topological specificity factor MinE